MDKKQKHTPGPWRIVKTGDNPPSWNVWADAIEDEDGTLCHDLYSEADAHLIAAAPELLEACRAFVHWYAEDSSEFNRDTAYEKALAAINKAEGQTCPNCGSANVEVEPEHEEGERIFCFDCDRCPKCGGEVGHRVNCPDGMAFSHGG